MKIVTRSTCGSIFSPSINTAILILISTLLMLLVLSLPSHAISCTKYCYDQRNVAYTKPNCQGYAGGFHWFVDRCHWRGCLNNEDDKGHKSHFYYDYCKWGQYPQCGSYTCSDYWGSSLNCVNGQAYRNYFVAGCGINKCTYTEEWRRYTSWDYKCEVDCGLRFKTNGGIVRAACKKPADATTPLRIYNGGIIYGIILVDVSDPLASPVRIKTPSGIKAIKKLA